MGAVPPSTSRWRHLHIVFSSSYFNICIDRLWKHTHRLRRTDISVTSTVDELLIRCSTIHHKQQQEPLREETTTTTERFLLLCNVFLVFMFNCLGLLFGSFLDILCTLFELRLVVVLHLFDCLHIALPFGSGEP